MYIILFFSACYLMRWSVSLLSDNVLVTPIGSMLAFCGGIVAVLITAWTGLHIL